MSFKDKFCQMMIAVCIGGGVYQTSKPSTVDFKIENDGISMAAQMPVKAEKFGEKREAEQTRVWFDIPANGGEVRTQIRLIMQPSAMGGNGSVGSVVSAHKESYGSSCANGSVVGETVYEHASGAADGASFASSCSELKAQPYMAARKTQMFTNGSDVWVMTVESFSPKSADASATSKMLAKMAALNEKIVKEAKLSVGRV